MSSAPFTGDADLEEGRSRSPGRASRSWFAHVTPSGTRLSLHVPAAGAATARSAAVWVVLFDGLAMIEEGVPESLARAQASGVLPSMAAVYVESIDGAAKRGPARCASLTTAGTLARLAAELDSFLAASGRSERSRTVLVGHSLGAIAALHLASTQPGLSRDVVLLSAALWWPGDDGQLSGDDVVETLIGAPEVRVWMTAGDMEEQKLLRSNDALFARLSAAGRTVLRASHHGAHAVRPEDVVTGVGSLVGGLPN